jgi:tetratricopeptide (TPR) repeat protein
MTDDSGSWDQASLRRLLDAVISFNCRYDVAIHKAIEVARREGRSQEQAIARLREAGPPAGAVARKPRGRYGPWALCSAYLKLSFEARYTDPHVMRSFAEAAVDVALDTNTGLYSKGVVFDLRGRAYAELANALRVNNRFAAAEDSINNAKKWFSQGSGDSGLLARILVVEASLRIEKRRLSEAAQLLDRAHDIYLEIGDLHLAGRTLLNRAYVASSSGASKAETVALLERSLGLLDRHRDPQLVATASHSLILHLTECGEYQRAGELLLASGLRQVFAAQPLNHLRLRWVEGRVHAGMERFHKAEPIFQDVREGFRRLELEYDAALVGLELCAVWLRQGKNERAARLAGEMRETFQRLSQPVEAQTALAFLVAASNLGFASVPIVEHTRDFLQQLREDPELKFSAPAFR